MLCKQTIKEASKQRSCWLPADSTSPFGFCRRCHYNKITELLDTTRQDYIAGRLPSNESILTERFFLEESLHPGRQQAFLSLLNILFEKRRDIFDRVLKTLQGNCDFQVLSERVITHHTCGSRCQLYRHLIKTYGESHEHVDTCWHCIAWTLRKAKDIWEWRWEKKQKNIVHALGKITLLSVQTYGLDTFLDIMTSLHIYELNTLLGFFFLQLESLIGRENTETLAIRFYSQPPLLDVSIAKKIPAYMPPEWKKEPLFEAAYEAAKKTIHDRLAIFHDELLAAAWHPNRVVHWCMSAEELKGFSEARTFVSR